MKFLTVYMKGFTLDKGQIPIHYLKNYFQLPSGKGVRLEFRIFCQLNRSLISRNQGFIYAFSPIVTGLPSTVAVVTALP